MVLHPLSFYAYVWMHNCIWYNVLKLQARQHAHDLLFNKLISAEVARKAVAILIDSPK